MEHDHPLTGLRTGPTLLVALYAMRFALRSGGGIISMLLILVSGLGVGSVFTSSVEQGLRRALGTRQGVGAARDALEQVTSNQQLHDAVEWVTGNSPRQVEYLLRERPALLSAIFLVLFMLFPFVVCLGAFNQTAGDIGSRGLRYLLLRTERANIFMGRFLGSLLFASFSLLLVVTVTLFYLGFKLKVYPPEELVGWGLQGLVALFFLILPHIALCAWVSSLVSNAFAALATCLSLVGIPILLLKAAGKALGEGHDWFLRFLPWGWKYDLLSASLSARLLAFGVMAAFTLLFLTLGLVHFHRRDL